MTALPDFGFWTLPAVFLAGAAASFTPCVYPLVPVVVAVIGATGEATVRRRFALTLSYALGLSLVYASLGLAAGLSGALFGRVQAHFASSLVVGFFFLLFGLALLGVVRLPLGFLARAGSGRRFRGKGFFPVFLAGAASSFIAAPCTVPVAGALLAWVFQARRAVGGFFHFFAFALGLNTLLILAGTVSGFAGAMKRFNRWTPVVQKVMSAFLIAAGLYLVWRGLARSGLLA